MNLEPKRLWIEALTNGDYVKVCGVMRKNRGDVTSNHMCVMGVLSDIAFRKSGLKLNVDNWAKYAIGNSEPTTLTLDWAGLSRAECSKLIGFNDSNGKTFGDLAKYIEENL